MTRLLLVLAAATLLLPGAAGAAACSPLDCAPSQFTLSHGTLVGYRHTALGPVSVADLRSGKHLFTVPGGFVGGNVLVHHAGRQLTWFDLRTGKAHGHVTLPRNFGFAGVSQDGSRAVGFRKVNGATAMLIVSPHYWRQVPLPAGDWAFDALYGWNLFLIKYVKNGYQVQYVDLSTDSPKARLIKDPHESGTIWGSPFARLASSDGRMLFTLYVSANGGAMVHELNVAKPQARCIDLPGTGDYNAATSWALAIAPGGRTLWAADAGYGRVVAIDVRTRKVAQAFRLDLPFWAVTATRAALSPGSAKLAIANGEEVAVIDLHRRAVVARQKHRATAVGFAATGLLRMLR